MKRHLAQKETFQKAKTHELDHIKMELMNQSKRNGHNFLLNSFVVSFGNSVFNNSNWDRISEGIIKKSISGTE